MTNPPKKSTVYITAVLAILGLILWLVSVLIPLPGLNFPFQVLGFLLLFFSWLLLAVACFVKGL